MNTTKRELTPKKPYDAPSLTVHGDLRTLTQAGSNGNGENGKCNSKNPTKCARA